MRFIDRGPQSAGVHPPQYAISSLAVLLPTMPGIVGSFSPLQGIKIGANLAAYGVTRMIAGERRLFLIYFIRGVDGV